MGAISTGIMLGLSAVSALSQAKSQRKQANAAVKQGEYEAGILTSNAAAADAQGVDAILRGNTAANNIGSDTQQLIGAQRTALAAQGIRVDDGSAADIQETTSALGAFDMLTAKNNAAREALGFTTEAIDLRRRAELTRQGAQNTADGLRAASTGTLLTGGAQAFAAGREYWKNRVPRVGRPPVVPKAGRSGVDSPRGYGGGLA